MRARAPGASASTGGSAGKAIAVIALERQLRSRLRLRWRVRWQRNSGTSERSHTALQWRDHSLKDATRSPITNTTFFALCARSFTRPIPLFTCSRPGPSARRVLVCSLTVATPCWRWLPRRPPRYPRTRQSRQLHRPPRLVSTHAPCDAALRRPCRPLAHVQSGGCWRKRCTLPRAAPTSAE